MTKKEVINRTMEAFKKTVNLQNILESMYPGYMKYTMALSSVKIARGMQNEPVLPCDILKCAEVFTDMKAAKDVWYPEFLESINQYLSSAPV